MDIFIRFNERCALISCVEAPAAQDFMQYVKRNDIFMHVKRVCPLLYMNAIERSSMLSKLEFMWSDRQFDLPSQIAYKIGRGATRSLLIRNAPQSSTDERLREDLDHIHNLVIVDITFLHGDAYLELNSVHNALFARSLFNVAWNVQEKQNRVVP